LQRSASNLEEDLRLRGHAEAAVEILSRDIDRQTGAVRARIRVREGPVWRVTSLVAEVPEGEQPPPESLLLERVERPWSSLWRQDTSTAIRNWYYERGHPDVRVRLENRPLPLAEGETP